MSQLVLSERKPGENNREYAFRILLDNILKWNLEPGSKLSENEIAAQLELSRTPIREALIELGKLHLVEIYPQRKSIVSLIDTKLVEDAILMRSTLECAIAQEAALKATEQDIYDLRANIKLQEFYFGEYSSEQWLATDQEFHRLLFKAADRMYVYEQMRNMTIHFDRVRHSGRGMDLDKSNMQDHMAVVNAIERRNPEGAKVAMDIHIGRFLRYDFITLMRARCPHYIK